MKEERIQKVMAERGLCSRRAAEKLIEEGRVLLNGRPVHLGDKMDPKKDLLSVDGKALGPGEKEEAIHLMLYKPRGYLSTARDDRGRKTVMDLVSDVPGRLFPVGRLDKDSEGLLFMTNDGAFAQALTHPSGGVAKVYRITVHPKATEEQVARLAAGVRLDDGYQTRPITLRVLAEEEGRSVLELVLREGKNRQIHRMCETVGLTVARLKRSAVGPVRLGMLQPGQYRPLTKQEVAGLMRGSKE